MVSNVSNQAAPTVAVIGGGLGGLSAALSLAAGGCSVDLYEKNSHLGGKLNVLTRDGFSFDLGPSIFTLPQIFQQLFARAGRRMEDYLTLQPVTPHWRNFFEDGRVVDLDPDAERMNQQLALLGPGLEKPFREFLNYSKKQYDLVEEGYFQQGLDTFFQLLKYYRWRVFGLDFLSTMHRSVCCRLPNAYLQDIFDFFIKYVGSSAVRAPGFMNLMPHIQFGYGLWYVEGGMYNLARGLEKVLRELGVRIHCNCEVTAMPTEGRRVSGVQAGGQFHPAQWVVCNMEVIPAYKKLLPLPPSSWRRLQKYEPACSGIVIHLGVDRIYERLAHHNFFYSGNQRKHFDTVFRQHQLPDDPTLYVVAPARSDRTVAPPGCDNIKILPHIPWINDELPCPAEDYLALKERVLDKLERMGLQDLRKHIVLEHFWTPVDIRSLYASNGGAIYGVVSDIWKNLAFKAPKQCREFANLLFVGGSVNPGGGMPMVTLCGQLASDIILRNLQRQAAGGYVRTSAS
ncbi:MAG: phytoene desaturase [Oligosphaeraceae bacterium]|nr:phytoene desaturase [Oligosphaeraceae bacterium]